MSIKQNVNLNKDIVLDGVNNFEQTNISSFLVQCLSKCGFTRPTPIQYHSIIAFSKYPQHNIVAQSKSGTGKTLAYLIPVLNELCLNRSISTDNHNYNRHCLCVIILPTRQLSIQVHQHLKQIITSSIHIKSQPLQRQYKQSLTTITSLLTIGGIPIQDDKKMLLTTGANFVIGTVGKIYQLIQTGCLKVEHVKYVVCDEGDKLFQGRDDKLRRILQRVSVNGVQEKKVKFLVFSATYDQDSIQKTVGILSKLLQPHQPRFLFIQTLTHSVTNQYIENITQNWRELNFIKFLPPNQKNLQQQKTLYNSSRVKQINESVEIINLDNIKKYCIEIDDSKSSLLVRKCNVLKKVLQELNFSKCLIFVQKKALLDQIYDQLKQYQPLVIHGSLTQASRIKAMNQAKKSRIIISSDLLARGIDLVLDLVILYDAQINETLWHRIGRTGRFGRVGVALSLEMIHQWRQYDKDEINSILRQSSEQNIINKLKGNDWYGTYMTEYGQWQEIDVQNQKIINQNYNFFEQQQQAIIVDQRNISKKMRKEMKKIQKRVVGQMRMESQKAYDVGSSKEQHDRHGKGEMGIRVKQAFESEEQFLLYYQTIFSCSQCLALLERTTRLTGYQFQTKKYFTLL